MPIKNYLKSLLFFVAPILFFGCSNTGTDQVKINTDLSEYGLDTLQLRDFNSKQIDSLAKIVNQNIKQDYQNNQNTNLKEEEYFGDKLYGYYLRFPDSKNGLKHLKYAFAIWSTSGAVNKIETVLNNISLNKDYWAELANYYHLYQLHLRERSWLPFIDRWKRDAYLTQVSTWNKKTTNEKTRTHLNFYIAETHFWYKDYQKADNYLLKVLELNRDSVLTGSEDIVDKAQSYYNEIHALQVGDKAPTFSATSITGQSINLAEYRDKVVLIEFWSTTCGPCIKELPNLRDLYSSLESREDFVMIGVSLDTDIEKVRRFTKEHNMEWKQIFDNGFGKISELYNAAYIPRTYVIDKEGQIGHKNLMGERLRNTVTKMLE